MRKAVRSAIITLCVFVLVSGFALAQDNQPMMQKFPSAHVLVHYYCPDCPQSEKDHVADVASVINHQDDYTFTRLLPSHPEAADLINIKYRFIQYVQFMKLNGTPNSTGEADLALLAEFAGNNGYNVEDFFLHFSEPTQINNLGVTVTYDGNQTNLRDSNGGTHYLGNDRAVAIVWGDFYYVYDWHSEPWYQFVKWRTQNELGDQGGYEFDGYFQDVLNGPITDTYYGVSYGGGIREFGGKTPSEITSDQEDHELICGAQGRLNQDVEGKVFMPNSGNYTQDWALETMLAGDGTITEAVNMPGGQWWSQSWENAKAVAANKKYYSLASYWSSNNIPSGYDAGVYGSSLERGHLQNAAWYWMAYEPGFVAFDVSRACCDWSGQWPKVMEADIGTPLGDLYLADQGTLTSGWKWKLYAREYTKATVYYRGNMAWRDGNGAANTYGSGAGVQFALPQDAMILNGDGAWVNAPSSIMHMESFGFVVSRESGGDDDDDTGDDDTGDDDSGDDDTGDDDTGDDDSGDDDTGDDDTGDDDSGDDDTGDDDTGDDDTGDDDTGDDDDDDDFSPNMTFYHRSAGEGYQANGMTQVLTKHGFDLNMVRFGSSSNCACNLSAWFSQNPTAMVDTVMIESSYYCSNLWSDGEADQVRACYEDMRQLADNNGAKLLIVAPTPYAREEMEAHGWRSIAQRGANLFDSLEMDLGLLNANRILRDESLPYLDELYQIAPNNSTPNNFGYSAVITAMDSWLPDAEGIGDDDDDTGDDDSGDDDTGDDDSGDDDSGDDDTGDDDSGDDDTGDDDTGDDDTGDDDDIGDDDTGDDDDDDDGPPKNMTFFHRFVGTCYEKNGLEEVATSHGFDYRSLRIPISTYCACNLRDWFAANPDQMTGTVMVKSNHFCSNVWSLSEANSVRQCYGELLDQAEESEATLLILSPTPYAREEMEENGWRGASQLGANLFDSLEDEFNIFNANALLRDEALPYLDEAYQRRPNISNPNDKGCAEVVSAIDAWLPYAAEDAGLGGRDPDEPDWGCGTQPE